MVLARASGASWSEAARLHNRLPELRGVQAHLLCEHQCYKQGARGACNATANVTVRNIETDVHNEDHRCLTFFLPLIASWRALLCAMIAALKGTMATSQQMDNIIATRKRSFRSSLMGHRLVSGARVRRRTSGGTAGQPAH